ESMVEPRTYSRWRVQPGGHQGVLECCEGWVVSRLGRRRSRRSTEPYFPPLKGGRGVVDRQDESAHRDLEGVSSVHCGSTTGAWDLPQALGSTRAVIDGIPHHSASRHVGEGHHGGVGGRACSCSTKGDVLTGIATASHLSTRSRVSTLCSEQSYPHRAG